MAVVCLLFLGAAIHLWAAEQPAARLSYTEPAEKGTDALPIGNGRLSALVYGGISDEHVQFNAATLTNGQSRSGVRAGAAEWLTSIRLLLAEGKTSDDGKLTREKFLGDPLHRNTDPPPGDLHLHFVGHENATDYRRELDLDSATARVIYRVDEVVYRREAFASYPDQAIILRLTADHHGRLDFTLKLDSPLTNSQTRALAADTLALTGQVDADGGKFATRIKVTNVGGHVTINGNVISVQSADSATLFLTAAIRLENVPDANADPADRCAQDLAKVSQRKFETIFADHLADYRGRVGR